MTHISAEADVIAFVESAAKQFAENPRLATYTAGDITGGCLLAIRWGLGEDCVLVVRIADTFEPAIYQQAIKTTRLAEIRAAGIDPLDDRFVVVTERDHDDPMKSRGPIAMETYIGESTLVKAVKQAEGIGGRYGRALIHKLVPVGDLQFCRRVIDAPLDEVNANDS